MRNGEFKTEIIEDGAKMSLIPVPGLTLPPANIIRSWNNRPHILSVRARSIRVNLNRFKDLSFFCRSSLFFFLFRSSRYSIYRNKIEAFGAVSREMSFWDL